MASDDFLKRGINCVVYKNGRTVNIADYAKMSLRTSTTRATLYAGGAKRHDLGIHTVKMSSYGMCSPTCLPWQGRVYVDDVYSGGTAAEASRLHLPLLSTAIEGGAFHPNCKHVLTTYYMNGTQNTDAGDPRNTNDRKYLKKWENSPQEIEHLRLQNQIQQQKRIAAGSVDQSKMVNAQNNVNQLEKKDEMLNYSDAISTNLAENLIEKAKKQDKIVTPIMKEIVDTGTGHLEGIDFRIKGLDSLSRKIKEKSVKKGISMEEYSNKVTDILRYTNVSEPSKLSNDYFKIVEGLKNKGYNVIEVTNSFGTPGYKGINTLVKSPDGYIFELQYHTPESFRIKELNHKLYEEFRLDSTNLSRKKELAKMMNDIFNKVKLPRDIDRIRNKREV